MHTICGVVFQIPVFFILERGWNHISKLLVGVTLPAILPGETTPPWLQNDIDPEEKEKKTDEVFYQVCIIYRETLWYLTVHGYGSFLPVRFFLHKNTTIF